MALIRKQKQGQRPVADSPEATPRHTAPRTDDPTLPGIAGYQGIEPLPKGAMPIHRFTYRRPDGKG
jgi:hypothetical protein